MSYLIEVTAPAVYVPGGRGGGNVQRTVTVLHWAQVGPALARMCEEWDFGIRWWSVTDENHAVVARGNRAYLLGDPLDRLDLAEGSP